MEKRKRIERRKKLKGEQRGEPFFPLSGRYFSFSLSLFARVYRERELAVLHFFPLPSFSDILAASFLAGYLASWLSVGSALAWSQSAIKMIYGSLWMLSDQLRGGLSSMERGPISANILLLKRLWGGRQFRFDVQKSCLGLLGRSCEEGGKEAKGFLVAAAPHIISYYSIQSLAF